MAQRKIAVFTGTRADYGLLYSVLKGIQNDPDLELQLIVSGMHLSPEFGLTYRRIEKDGFEIAAKVEMLLSSDTPVGIAKAMGLGTIGFADALNNLRPDLLIVLGDRFEALAISQTASVMRIPIAHLHGGEITEGAYDDAIRHAITKMATWHFVAAEPYRKRVIQLGESPDRVHNVGAVGLDHLMHLSFMSVEELGSWLDFPLRQPYFLVSYHSVTLGDEGGAAFATLLEALDGYSAHQVILTYPNADNGGRELIDMLESYAAARPGKALAVKSLGQRGYLSAAKWSHAVVGNSSSGIIEAPSLGVPTVNIGERQGGRLSAPSVIHCGTSRESIDAALKTACSEEHRRICAQGVNPYGRGDAAGAILDVLRRVPLDIRKRFYDIE